MSIVIMSDKVDKIIPAIVKAQAEFDSVSKDADNPFFRSKYATLQNVVDTTRPVLSEHGLAVSQFPTSGERGEVGIITMLMHTSGQWMQHGYNVHVPDAKNMAQEAGKVITYFRRYAYASALGIVIDEDNDGNNPSQRKPAQNKKASPKPKAQPDQALIKKRNHLHALGKEAYADDWDAKREELVASVTKGRSTSSNDCKPEELDRLISGMKKVIEERKPVQAQIAGTEVRNGAHS